MLVPPNCFKRKCKHFEGVDSSEDGEEFLVCSAFPEFEGIPSEIAYGEDKHSEVRPDQVGDFVFEEEK